MSAHTQRMKGHKLTEKYEQKTIPQNIKYYISNDYLNFKNTQQTYYAGTALEEL